MDEEFESLVVTDPDIVDEGIDISGLRTQTDVSPYLLGNIPDYAGIQYEAFNPKRLSDLMRLYSSGLPAIDTSTAAPPATGGGGSGDGGQATVPGAIDTLVTPPDTGVGVNTPEDQRLIDAGIGVQAAPGQPVVAPGEIPYTQDVFDEFNRRPVTPVSPPGQPIDPTGMLPQTSTPYMVEGALGVDPREKMDFVTEEDLADTTNLLQRLGLPADFDLKRAALEAGINLAVGVPITLIARGLEAVLPDRDPRQTALEGLYDVKDGTIQSGLMKGYNPVSGNPLDPTYGLQEAYQDRIDTIENTLKTKYNMTDAEIADVKAGSYTGDVDTNLFKTLTDLENAKEKEKNVLDLYSGDIGKEGTGDAMLAEQIEAQRIRDEADDKEDDMFVPTSTGVNPFADIDTGVGEFDTTPTTSVTKSKTGTIASDKFVTFPPDYLDDEAFEEQFGTTPGGAIPPGEKGGPGYIEPPMTLADDKLNKMTDDVDLDLFDTTPVDTTPIATDRIGTFDADTFDDTVGTGGPQQTTTKETYTSDEAFEIAKDLYDQGKLKTIGQVTTMQDELAAGQTTTYEKLTNLDPVKQTTDKIDKKTTAPTSVTPLEDDFYFDDIQTYEPPAPPTPTVPDFISGGRDRDPDPAPSAPTGVDAGTADVQDYFDDYSYSPSQPDYSNVPSGKAPPSRGGDSGGPPSQGGGSCCFIMLEARYGDGTMDKVVRRYRDENMTPRNRRGYYKVAEVLVPLMRKSKIFKWIVTKTFADPLVSYGKWYYGENKHGWIFAPLKSAWLKLFDVVGTDTVFIRENGEEV